MFPEICKLGPLTLRSFGLMAAMGFMCAYFAMRRHSQSVAGLHPDGASQLLVFAMVGGALGARLAYVAEHWTAEFAGLPLTEVFRFDKGGLMFYGGLGGAIVAIALFSSLARKSFWAMLDLAALALPLGHAFGRVGCFLNGCCYGRVTQSFLGVRYPAGSEPWHAQVAQGLLPRSASQSLPVVPSQLVEALLNLAIFAALLALARRRPRRLAISGTYLVSYAFVRFFTETLRSDPRMAVGPFTISQFICLLVLAAGVAFLVASRGMRPVDAEGQAGDGGSGGGK